MLRRALPFWNGMNTVKKVLFIADDIALFKLLQSSFAREEIEFSIAILPEEGLYKVFESLPDLVILDMILPGISGLKILDRIRKNLKTKNVTVLVLTIDSEKETIQEAKKLGVVDYITKGAISLKELEDKIKAILWPTRS